MSAAGSRSFTAAVSEPASLSVLFEPDTVAVAGASPDLRKPGGRCLAFLKQFGYGGRLYPINPRYAEIGGDTCYPALGAIPDRVDLLVLVVPAKAVPGYVLEAAQRSVRAIIVCSSGFSETGADGVALEDEVRTVACGAGMALVGVNSLGLLDLNSNLAATFTTALQHDTELRPGPVAFVSQSGAMGAAIFSLAQSEGIPTGRFVSTGNETVLDFSDYVEYLSAKDDVSVILGYIEGLDDGRRLVSCARNAREHGKVVAVLKSGTSDAGREAARSHTGAITGSAEVYEAAFRRAGVLSASSPRELLDTAIAVAAEPRAGGDRVGIVSMSGGAGVMIADRCGEVGLRVPPLSDATRARLTEVLPAYAGMRNPVDLGGVYSDPAAVEACVRIVIEDAHADMVIVFIGLSPLMAGEIEARLHRVREAAEKPLIVAWLAGPSASVAELGRLGVPAYEDPIRAVNAAAQMWAAARPLGSWVERPSGSERADAARALLLECARSGPVMNEREVKDLLCRYDVPVVDERFARTPEEAVAAAREFGGRVVVKGEAVGLVHKSDHGAVCLGVEPSEAGEAFVAVTAALRAAGITIADITGAVVQPMVPSGLELLVGVKHDAQFGPIVAVGLGGTENEAIKDVVVELAPVSPAQAGAMLDRLRGRILLDAFRGRAPRDRGAVTDLISKVATFGLEAGSLLRELDLNPVTVFEDGAGCRVLDGAAIVAEPEGDGDA